MALFVLLLLIGTSTGWSEARDRSKPREVAAGIGTGAQPQAGSSSDKVTFVMDFSDYAQGPIEVWLRAKGFRFAHGARDPELLEFSFRDGALHVEAKGHVRGFLVNEAVTVERFSSIRLHWGIIKYPANASYERGIHNEALMVYVLFGQEKLPSGQIGIPDLPYFIGLFLGETEKINTPYMGKYFQEGGRFVSVGNPPPHQTIMSEFDLIAAFHTYFGKADVPMISGIGLGVDTSASAGDGKAAAYLHRIEFLE